MNISANMNPMVGGPVGGGGPMPMMNNGAVPHQPGPPPVPSMDNRAILNTYIYEYFLRNNMFDCARAILNSNQPIRVQQDGKNGDVMGNGVDDSMDTDSKDDIDSKRPGDLPAPSVPVPVPDSCFLYEWFCLFWDMFNAQRGKASGSQVSQYVAHTQQQSRVKQNQQQEMLRNIRPDQFQMMKNMANAGMLKQQGNLARTAMANNQNPNMIMMAKQNMQRDPSNMDGNQQRAGSPGSSENAPSPSKRPRLDGPNGQFPNQPGMMRNGGPQGVPGQPVGTGPGSNFAQTHQMLLSNGIDPASLTPSQLNNFANQAPMVQAKSIQTYAQNLHQHHGSQMPSKQMPNPGGPQGQGSPMIPQGPDGIPAFYNGADMTAGGMRQGGPGVAPAGGSNHALQDYQMQLMLLEQQNKKRLMMARQEQNDITTGVPRPDGPPGPGAGPGPGPNAPPGVAQPGPNGQGFQDSPQGPRAGTSPNPTDMKRGTPQMNNASIPSPLPEGGAQNRGSPNAMNFMGMGNQMDPSGGPHFFNGIEGNRVANAQMNGAMRPPSSHPGQPSFNGQPMTPQQQQMMVRQQQAQGQPGAQGGPNAMQWQQGGPNGNPTMPQVPQGPQPVQNTPQQRAMPPPSAPPTAGNNTNARNTTASPQQNTQPPTPKPSAKKKDSKSAKDKRTAAQKKSATLNASAAPAADNNTQDAEPPTPATPITPVTSFAGGKPNAANTPAPQPIPNGQVSAATPSAPSSTVVPPPQDPNQNSNFMDGSQIEFNLEFANPMTSDNVLDNFDFDSFLHDQDETILDFSAGSFAMEGGEIGAESVS